MQNEIIEVDGQRWRVTAKSRQRALDEIAFARATGSVGSSTILDKTRVGGGKELLAEVRRVDADGNDVKAS